MIAIVNWWRMVSPLGASLMSKEKRDPKERHMLERYEGAEPTPRGLDFVHHPGKSIKSIKSIKSMKFDKVDEVVRSTTKLYGTSQDNQTDPDGGHDGESDRDNADQLDIWIPVLPILDPQITFCNN